MGYAEICCTIGYLAPGQAEASRVDARPHVPGGTGSAGTDRVAGRTRVFEHGDRQTGGVSRPTVIHWRDRYTAGGTRALEDRPRSGRPREIDPLQIVVATLEPPPERLGVTHGSSRLLAAELGCSNATVEVATGKVVDACHPRHRHQEFLKFLKQVAKAYPRVELHVVLDNYGTHKHPEVRSWLEKNPPGHAALHPDQRIVAEHGGATRGRMRTAGTDRIRRSSRRAVRAGDDRGHEDRSASPAAPCAWYRSAHRLAVGTAT